MSTRLAGIGMTSQRTRARLIERLRAKGIRNVVAVAYLVECAHHVAREIATPFRERGVDLAGLARRPAGSPVISRPGITLASSKDNTDKATVAFVVANAAVASDKKTLVFLSIEGVRLCQKGYADDIHESGFAPLKDLMTSFTKAGGTIWVCSQCFKKRGLNENNLIEGARWGIYANSGYSRIADNVLDGCEDCITLHSPEENRSTPSRMCTGAERSPRFEANTR